MTIVWSPSPNYTEGRAGHTVDKIVVHWCDATLDQAVKHFQVDGSKYPFNGVSAHFVVEDTRVVQCVKAIDTGWHAGDFLVNQTSIGIEHSADPFRPASDATYATSGALIAQLCKQLGLPLTRRLLHPHKEFKATACPGTIDLDRLFEEASKAFNTGTVGQFSGYDQSVAPGIPATTVAFHVPVYGDKVAFPPNGYPQATVHAPTNVRTRIDRLNDADIKEVLPANTPQDVMGIRTGVPPKNSTITTYFLKPNGLYFWSGTTDYNGKL